MSYIENIETFEDFCRGDYIPSLNELKSNEVRLIPEDMDVGGGHMKIHEIDKLKDYPNADIVTISGLDQEGFEYFIKN